MHNFLISCLVCAAMFAAPLAAAILPHPELFERENRRLWPFPDWPDAWEQRFFLRYFKGIDQFFPDRFPLREALLAIARTPYQLLGESPDFSTAFRGKGDFLFIGNDDGGYHVERLEGLHPLKPSLILEKTTRFLEVANMARTAGSDFVIIIGPNKSSVYPEYLPDVISPANTRFIQPLIDALRAADIKVYDPTERLRRKKFEGLLYFKTDTHWTMLGAFEAFEGFREYMGLPPLPHPSFYNGTETRDGDLFRLSGFRDYPIRNEVTETFVRWEPPLEKPITDKTIWIFGDSFQAALCPYMQAMFMDIEIFPQASFKKTMVDRINCKKPDIIIWVNVERFFVEK